MKGISSDAPSYTELAQHMTVFIKQIQSVRHFLQHIMLQTYAKGLIEVVRLYGFKEEKCSVDARFKFVQTQTRDFTIDRKITHMKNANTWSMLCKDIYWDGSYFVWDDTDVNSEKFLTLVLARRIFHWIL